MNSYEKVNVFFCVFQIKKNKIKRKAETEQMKQLEQRPKQRKAGMNVNVEWTAHDTHQQNLSGRR